MTERLEQLNQSLRIRNCTFGQLFQRKMELEGLLAQHILSDCSVFEHSYQKRYRE